MKQKIQLTEDDIKKLLEFEKDFHDKTIRFKRWQKEGKDRLYIDSAAFGLYTWRTRSSGYLNVELPGYSKYKANFFLPCKNYIDLKKQELVSINLESPNYNFFNELKDLVESILADTAEDEEKEGISQGQMT